MSNDVLLHLGGGCLLLYTALMLLVVWRDGVPQPLAPWLPLHGRWLRLAGLGAAAAAPAALGFGAALPPLVLLLVATSIAELRAWWPTYRPPGAYTGSPESALAAPSMPPRSRGSRSALLRWLLVTFLFVGGAWWYVAPRTEVVAAPGGRLVARITTASPFLLADDTVGWTQTWLRPRLELYDGTTGERLALRGGPLPEASSRLVVEWISEGRYVAWWVEGNERATRCCVAVRRHPLQVEPLPPFP
jgi:hypothetical protein